MSWTKVFGGLPLGLDTDVRTSEIIGRILLTETELRLATILLTDAAADDVSAIIGP